MLKYLKLLLLPLSGVYWVATGIRNILFTTDVYSVHKANIPVISVGNITVGGTGKTPHIELVLSILEKAGRNTAALSRGYKRLSSGFVLYKEGMVAETIGDEPKQIAMKFPAVKVAVCEKRAEGIRKLQSLFSDIDTIVLDDAFQHRHVQPSLSLLMVDYNRPIWSDFVFPAGMMREGFYARHRADAVIITKCPADLNKEASLKIAKKIRLTPEQQLFFSTVTYSNPVFVQKGKPMLTDAPPAVVITGISQHKQFSEHIGQYYSVTKAYHFADHHHFSDEELKTALMEASQIGGYIVTTEKDATRISGRELLADFPSVPVVYYPIKPRIQFGEEHTFEDLIVNHVKNFRS